MVYHGRYRDPLVSGTFEAWDYGPIHPELFHKAKRFGSGPVRRYIFLLSSSLSGEISRISELDRITDLSGNDGAKLVSITHWHKGAWAKHYQPSVTGIQIPSQSILNEYNARFNNK